MSPARTSYWEAEEGSWNSLGLSFFDCSARALIRIISGRPPLSCSKRLVTFHPIWILNELFPLPCTSPGLCWVYLSCSLNPRQSEMEGHLRAHDRPCRGVATPCRCRGDSSKSRFWVVRKAQYTALSPGRRHALYFTGDTTKSSSCILQSCVVGAETDGILLYLLYSPGVFSCSLNIFWRGLHLPWLVFPSVILDCWEESQAFSHLKTHTHNFTVYLEVEKDYFEGMIRQAH